MLTDRDRAVRDLFRAAKFWTKENRDFRDWLWYHFILDSALGAKAIETGGLVAVMDSPQELKGAVLLVVLTRHVG